MYILPTRQPEFPAETDDAQGVIEWALRHVDELAISFSGAEDVVLIDMACRLARAGKGRVDHDRLSVFSLDTGRLHPETYEYIEQVRSHYDIDLEILSPDHTELQALVREKGLFSFYQDGHSECCRIRKVAPLRRKLATLDGWITGQRRDQSIGTRDRIAVAETDAAFNGRNGSLAKFNPLALWSSERVWAYIREHDVPYNPLHARGFTSIGCQPCTRAVLPNQHEREGRWWWESVEKKECGLHAANRGAA